MTDMNELVSPLCLFEGCVNTLCLRGTLGGIYSRSLS